MFPNFDKFETSDQDVIFIEDSTGRVELKVKNSDLIYDMDENLVSDLTIGRLVDGLVVAVQGVMNSENKIEVQKVILPGLTQSNKGYGLKAEQIKLDPAHPGQTSDIHELLKSGGGNNLVALVCGLELNSNTSDLSNFRTMVDTLTNAEQNGFPDIKSLFILGDSFNVQDGINLNLAGSYSNEGEFQNMYDIIKETALLFDSCLLELGKKMNIVLLPGSKDPTDSFMPQQQLSRFLFYETSKSMQKQSSKPGPYQNEVTGSEGQHQLVLATNPVEISLDSHRFLLTSGQSIRNISKYSKVIYSFSYSNFLGAY